MINLQRNTMFRYVVVSYWGYPFGGGEEYLLQTLKWALEWGMEACWIAFTDSYNKPYEHFSVSEVVYNRRKAFRIHLPGGFSEDNLQSWLTLLRPDVVHHQGHFRNEIIRTCRETHCPVVSGFHFWHGVLKLDPISQNRNIRSNYSKHQVDPSFQYTRDNATVYVASEFMRDVIEKVASIRIKHVCYPASDETEKQAHIPNIMSNVFVTQINLHREKGGSIFLYAMTQLNQIPFQGVFTEHLSESLDSKIQHAAQSRPAPTLLLQHQEDVRAVYAKTRILLIPSLVDETFCRVAFEGLVNGIPILTTGAGYIKQLVGDAGIYISPSCQDDWVLTIQDLYYSENKIQELSRRAKKRAPQFSGLIAKAQFRQILNITLKTSSRRTVMLFVPWGDQGLGIQAQNYYRLLSSVGCKICIFSYLPYFSKDVNDKFQASKEEWIVPHIYYSQNTREEVSDQEILNFVSKYDVGTCIIPETCFSRVFQIARLLKTQNVRTFAIPNIEIVRKSELHLHKTFDKILCNNHLCFNYFQTNGFQNIEYISYAPYPMYMHYETFPSIETPTPIQFLLIGGMNVCSRKQGDRVCEAFRKIFETNPNMPVSLTITTQREEPLLKQFEDVPNITIVSDHLTYKDIQGFYETHHIVLQVSKHEGLGLGFFESIRCGRPVLTLNTAPHNEIIREGVNGWLIPNTYEPMKDNTEGLFGSAVFNVDDLVSKIETLEKQRHHILETALRTRKDYLMRFDANVFQTNFVRALGISEI